ncbi:MAG TPA: hypothetical protein VG815_17695, partial [Chloroflexota bacterium]|nr:hypothetical protein [Chloroflexota bacterium]
VRPGDLLGLSGYSRVRNMQLAVPLALGCDMIVAVDDDEVVTDPRFLERAGEGLGSTIDGHRVDGSGGYYLQDEAGRILLQAPPGSEHAPNLFDRKAVIMNEGTQALEARPGRIVPTPFCFGGNMVFAPELAASVCFDPSITRGEDIDYLINARLAGRWFFMNKDLRILHLPPKGGSYKDVAFHKVVQDVLRFVYEREKLVRWREIGGVEEVTAQDLDPYPGEFLGSNLASDARAVIEHIIDQTPETDRAALGVAASADEFLNEARSRADEGVRMYRSFQHAWGEMMAQLRQDASLTDYLINRMSVGSPSAA